MNNIEHKDASTEIPAMSKVTGQSTATGICFLLNSTKKIKFFRVIFMNCISDELSEKDQIFRVIHELFWLNSIFFFIIFGG